MCVCMGLYLVHRQKQKSQPGDVESVLPAISSRIVDVVISARYDFFVLFIHLSPLHFLILVSASFFSFFLSLSVKGKGDTWVPWDPWNPDFKLRKVLIFCLLTDSIFCLITLFKLHHLSAFYARHFICWGMEVGGYGEETAKRRISSTDSFKFKLVCWTCMGMLALDSQGLPLPAWFQNLWNCHLSPCNWLLHYAGILFRILAVICFSCSKLVSALSFNF